MERTVEGDKWVSRGWLLVLEILYETDVTAELRHVRVPENINEWGYDRVASLPKDSVLLTETELTEDQAVQELNYLLAQKLVHYRRPFEDDDFLVYRLTDAGFEVAHDTIVMQKQEKWRGENRRINFVLTLATAFLAATAVVQAYTSYIQVPEPNNELVAGGFVIVLVLMLFLLISRPGSRGPDLWG